MHTLPPEHSDVKSSSGGISGEAVLTGGDDQPEQFVLPLVVYLRCKDGGTYAPFAQVTKIPLLKKKMELEHSNYEEQILLSHLMTVDTLLSNIGRRSLPHFLFQGPIRAPTVEAPFSLSEWNLLQQYLDGYLTTGLTLGLALRYGVITNPSPQELESIKMPVGEKREKSLAAFPGGIVELTLFTEENELEDRCDTFKRALIRTSTILETYSFKLDDQTPDHKFYYRVDLKQFADAYAWPVLKIVLPALPSGLKWKSDVLDRLLINARLRNGDSTHYFISNGQSNQMMAQIYNVWPTKTNAYREMSPEQQFMRSQKPWLVAIPLMGPDIIDVLSKSCYNQFHLSYTSTRSSQLSFSINLQISLRQLVDGSQFLLDLSSYITEPVHVAFDIDTIWADQQTRRDWDCCGSIETKQASLEQRKDLQNQLCWMLHDMTINNKGDSPSLSTITLRRKEEEEEVEVEMDELQAASCVSAPDTCGITEQEQSLDTTTTTTAQEWRGWSREDGKSSTPPTNCPFFLPMIELQNFTLDIPASGILSNLPIQAQVSALLLNFIPSSKLINLFGGDSKNVTTCPLLKLQFSGCQTVLHECDACDLTELNWLKIGRQPPAGGALLLPFSYHPFESQNFEGILNLSTVSDLSLVLKFDPQYDPIDWQLSITSIVMNQKICQEETGIAKKFVF